MSNTVKNAGKYNKLIEIFSIESTKDDDGFEKPTETSILKTYASVKTTKGYTLIQNNSDFEKAYTNFTIRYPASIEYLNNINEDSIELEIQAKVVDK